MRKISFVLIMIVFLVAAANSISARGSELESIECRITKALKTSVKASKKAVRMAFKKELAARKRLQKDIELLAEVIYHENWHTDKNRLAAYYTGAVVMNRVHSKDWPNTIESVLYQKGQYSTTKYFFTKELPAEVYEMAERILRDGTDDVPDNVIFQAMRPLGKVWKKVNTDYFCYG